MTNFETNKPAKIIIADGHSIVRKGLISLLSVNPSWQIIAEASEELELLTNCHQFRPDLVILDNFLKGINGFDATHKVGEICRDTKLIVLTQFEDYDTIITLMEAGVNGIISKSSQLEEYIIAIKNVLADKSYYSPKIISLLKNNEKIVVKKEESNLLLTKQEKNILQLICQGLSSKEIGEKLFISTRTVETHRYNIMKKLELKNSTQLVRFALTNSKIFRTDEYSPETSSD